MRLTIPFILSALSYFSVAGALAEVPAPCLESDVRDLCPGSCAAACREAAFLEENATYCLNNGHFVDDPTAPGDAPACVEHFGTAIVVDPPLPPIPGEPTSTNTEAVEPEGPDCDALTDVFEQRECELAKVAPACSPTVTELEARARLLVTEIDQELAQYGDLLTRDWTDVNNRQRLCEFSRAQLSENYQIATQNPEILRTLQRDAGDIQACQRDWEEWMRDNAETDASDSLIDAVTRDAEEQLGPLTEQMEELGVSVAKLQSAAETILGIVDVHIIYCDPDGTPPPAQ